MSNVIEEMRLERERLIDERIRPHVQRIFDARGRDSKGKPYSIVLSFAQYWNDEATDAVHPQLTFIPADVTTVDDWLFWLQTREEAADALEQYHWVFEESAQELLYELTDRIGRYWFSEAPFWNANYAAPPFAAYCKEGATQHMDVREAYTPFRIFYGDGRELDISVCHRPHLLGVPCEYEER